MMRVQQTDPGRYAVEYCGQIVQVAEGGFLHQMVERLYPFIGAPCTEVMVWACDREYAELKKLVESES